MKGLALRRARPRIGLIIPIAVDPHPDPGIIARNSVRAGSDLRNSKDFPVGIYTYAGFAGYALSIKERFTFVVRIDSNVHVIHIRNLIAGDLRRFESDGSYKLLARIDDRLGGIA